MMNDLSSEVTNHVETSNEEEFSCGINDPQVSESAMGEKEFD